MIIEKDKLIKLLPNELSKFITRDTYEIVELKAESLISGKRFDLFFKIFFYTHFELNYNYAVKVYIDHIRAFTDNKFIEHDNPNKRTPEEFVFSALETFKSIKDNGFDSNISIIPLSKNGVPLNGSHRISASIVLSKSVKCVFLDIDDRKYDFEYFESRLVERKALDQVLLHSLDYIENLKLLVFYPVNLSLNTSPIEFFDDKIYHSNITMTKEGSLNLLYEVYRFEPFVYQSKTPNLELINKHKSCFRKSTNIDIFIINTSDETKFTKSKLAYREYIGVGKHSVHSTDNSYEAINLLKLLLNRNNIFALNSIPHMNWIRSKKILTKLQEAIYSNNLIYKDVLFCEQRDSRLLQY
jgi:hypothetical protein